MHRFLCLEIVKEKYNSWEFKRFKSDSDADETGYRADATTTTTKKQISICSIVNKLFNTTIITDVMSGILMIYEGEVFMVILLILPPPLAILRPSAEENPTPVILL